MFNLILKSIDNRSELARFANDRNLHLTGYGSEWTVCDADGQILALASNQVDAMAIAIFGG